jgi:hypothetical protein
LNWLQKEDSGLLGSTLEDGGTTFTQNLGNTPKMSQHHIPQDLNPQQYHCANPKSHAFTEHYKACAFYEGSSVALPCDTLYDTKLMKWKLH